MPNSSSSLRIGRPETELLLCCARTGRTPETADHIRDLLRGDVHWQYLLGAAHKHGIAPLLYWHLNAACPPAVPEMVFDRLRDHFRANSLRNLFLTEELLRLLNVFRSHGIPAISYKGPTLAASVYGNLALREFSDLDILVRWHDVPEAKTALACAGYRPQHRLTRAQEAAYLRSQHNHVFVREDGKSIVELHWEITERYLSFPLDTEPLWDRLERTQLGGQTVLSLSPEDTLLILCMHGAKHLWVRLGWVCDVAELIRARQDIRWERTMAQARALGGERFLLLGLFLASDLLGAALPGMVSDRARADPMVKTLAERVREKLHQEPDSPTGVLGVPYFHTFHLKMMKRWPGKMRYCVRWAKTQSVKDWEVLPLPSYLFPFLYPFYYVVRPIRLMGKYGPRMLKRLL